MLDQFDKKSWDNLISLTDRELSGNPVSEEELEAAMVAVCKNNIPPEAYASVLETTESNRIPKLESWLEWFVVNRKTEVKSRTEFFEKTCAFFQTLFAAGLLSVMFSQNFLGPWAWNVSAFTFLFGGIVSTWYREKHIMNLRQYATEENVANNS